MREQPIVSKIMRAIIVEDYASAISIITDKDFDPNDRAKAWNTPMISAIINVLSNLNDIQDKTSLKSIFKEIINHKDFDPNAVDIEGETILMHVARHPDFNWLAPFLFLKDNLDVDIKNALGHDVIDIAENNNNTVLMDLVISYRAIREKKKFESGNTTVLRGMPKKRVGIKTITKSVVQQPPKDNNEAIIKKIEFAFEEKQKNNPVSLYWLIKQFLKRNYSECLKIVNDVHFDPNERDRWEEPVITSLMYYSQDNMVSYDEEEFKKIAQAILNNRHFDYNSIDADCNTPIMVSMGFVKLNWLTELLFAASCTRIDVINDSGENLKEIAKLSKNEDLYNRLIQKSYALAEPV